MTTQLTDADYIELTRTKTTKTGRPPAGKPKKVRTTGDKQYLSHGKEIAKPQYNPENRSYSLLAKEKGTIRHVMSKRFLLDMYDDWRNYGTDVLEAVRREDPSTYLRIMASLVPKTLTIEDSSDGKSVGELRTELLVELGRALERGDAQLTEHIQELQQSERQGPVIEVHAISETEGLSQEREDS